VTKDRKFMAIGGVGALVAGLCCFTPLLVVSLSALGLSALVGWWLDLILFPVLALFLGVRDPSATPPYFGSHTRAARRRPVVSAYDIAVVGAGSAGFSAAITAAETGARVALIGHGMLGGTCVNVGCVPSKTLIRAVDSVHAANRAGRFGGIHGRVAVDDWSATVAAKDELVAAMRQAKYVDLLPEYESVDYIEGEARLIDRGVLVDDRMIAAPRIVIATGSRPVVPAIAGIERVSWLDSTAALAMDRLPESLLIVGAGFIGCELAQVFARAGTKVTLACRSRLLPQAEPEISAAMARCFAEDGIDIHAGVTYRSVRSNGAGVVLETEGAAVATLRAETVIAAVGRLPYSDGLGLEDMGIETTAGGGIRVDAHMQTTRQGVYAAGDVTGRDMYVYMAAHGARIAAKNALDDGDAAYDDSAVPAVVFTDPQVASVGLTEAVARTQGHSVETSILPLDQLPRALAARDTRGLIKLVADADTGRLLGAHIMAPEGGDSIQTAALAIHQGLTTPALAAMVFPYLTTVEGLKLAAQGFERDVTKLSCCAG
jgi:mercuric reductase